jgi:cytochrome c
MHFSLLEKIGASVLISAWLIYGANFVAHVLVPVAPPPGGAVHAAAPRDEAPAEPAAAAGPEKSIGELLAQADPAAGEKVFGKCKACHAADAGGAHKVGPNLWGIVGRPAASAAGFSYSAALTGKGGEWTYENLNVFLAAPKEFAQGNKMTFAGLKDPQDRAAVIAWLRTRSDAPKPLP